MKLGIVGTGMIVKTVLPLLRPCGWEPAAICSTLRSKAEGEALRLEYGMEAAYCELAQMLRESEMDAVYIAVPNHLHFAFAKQVLEAGKNAIVEKPLVGNWPEAQELSALAEKQGAFLFEAISTMYLPNFKRIRELLPQIGEVRLAACNFSQYSRRYDAFRQGGLPPVFDPEKLGGALMDLNSYNLHYLLGLFGEPKEITYHANIERGVDTSGVLMLEYAGFQAVAAAAKDCAAPANYIIQGTKGYLSQSTAANVCGAVTLHLNSGEDMVYSDEPEHRMMPEFQVFAREIASGNRELCKEMLLHSIQVSKALTIARSQILEEDTGGRNK